MLKKHAKDNKIPPVEVTGGKKERMLTMDDSYLLALRASLSAIAIACLGFLT